MSPALPGYVYFDPNFEFADGQTGEKLFVVLGDSDVDDDYVLVARTTSRPKTECQIGCYNDQYPACYCLPCNECEFRKDTWVMLDDVSEYEAAILQRWQRKLTLSLGQTKDLLLCGSQSIHLERWKRANLTRIANTL